MKQAIFRPLTADHKVDLGHLREPTERPLADLLPVAPAGDAPAATPPRPAISARARVYGGAVLAIVAVFLLAIALGSRTPAPAPALRASPPPVVPSAPAAPSS